MGRKYPFRSPVDSRKSHSLGTGNLAGSWPAVDYPVTHLHMHQPWKAPGCCRQFDMLARSEWGAPISRPCRGGGGRVLSTGIARYSLPPPQKVPRYLVRKVLYVLPLEHLINFDPCGRAPLWRNLARAAIQQAKAKNLVRAVREYRECTMY